MSKRTIFIFFVLVFLLSATAVQAAEPTTEVHVLKYATDGTTILNETTVTYQWMEENLPIYGDGITHYYHQGPVFEGDKWDPDETTNFKDMGAVRGTNVMDLCGLVGEMSPGDEVSIYSPDGYHVEFDYVNVYEPQPRQGPMVLCWYNGGDTKVGGERQGVGYPPDFYTGMRLVFFADNSTNSEGKHVFGNWDMNESLPEKCVHFYELYPSTNGLSVKWVDEIRIYSGGYTGDAGGPAKSMPDDTGSVPGFEVVLAISGLILVVSIMRWSEYEKR